MFLHGGRWNGQQVVSEAWVRQSTTPLQRDEFVLELNTVANINHFTIRTRFSGERLELRINEATGELNNLVVRGINSSRTR
jgi:hypothetical protein